MNKVLLILTDGVRPDGLAACGHPFLQEMLAHSIHTMAAQTVMPSVTLPCHVSLFLSVTPQRHGILTNTYVPQVRPINGICDVLQNAGRKNAMFYDWEELRDLARPGSLYASRYLSGRQIGWENTVKTLTASTMECIRELAPDFLFLYMGWPDEAGHGHGWMGPEYMTAINGCMDQIETIVRSLPEDYLVIYTADHGGHGRSHGSEMPEDMTIPLFLYHPSFPSTELKEANIIDIAPTALQVIGVQQDPDWEGRSLLNR